MLWYGVSGVSFNPTDPSEVMLNTGITAPLLSDHPRALVAPQVSQASLGSHPQQATISYGDPSMSQNNQVVNYISKYIFILYFISFFLS